MKGIRVKLEDHVVFVGGISGVCPVGANFLIVLINLVWVETLGEDKLLERLNSCATKAAVGEHWHHYPSFLICFFSAP